MASASSRSEEICFPLLDLAAELRNRIYEEALYHDRALGQLANVALLRVNKQINDEAKGLIYDRSAFTITLSVPPPPPSVADRISETGFLAPSSRLELSGDLNHTFVTNLRQRHPGPEEIYDLLSSSREILKFKCLKLVINPGCVLATTCFMYALAGLLNTPGRSTKKLAIKVNYDDHHTNQQNNRPHFWWSLAKMPLDLRILFHGKLSMSERRDLNYHILKDNKPHPERAPSAAFNSIVAWQRIKPWASWAYVQLALHPRDRSSDQSLPAHSDAYLRKQIGHLLNFFGRGELWYGETSFNCVSDDRIMVVTQVIDEWIDANARGIKHEGQLSDRFSEVAVHCYAAHEAWYDTAVKAAEKRRRELAQG